FVHRFAEMYPARVQAVAALSSGAYTLPQSCIGLGSQPTALPLPLGTANMPDWTGRPFDADAFRRIPFWLSVGADDVDVASLPSNYDNFLGNTRVARTKAFEAALQDFGNTSSLTIFPNAAHVVTNAM